MNGRAKAVAAGRSEYERQGNIVCMIRIAF